MNLVFLCHEYPYLPYENFVDDELRVLSGKFNRIIIINKSPRKEINDRFIPENSVIWFDENKMTFLKKVASVPLFIRLLFGYELKKITGKYRLAEIPAIVKLLFMDIARARSTMRFLSEIAEKEKIQIHNTVFYSYWHDFNALALSLFKEKNKHAHCIARSHGWDIFAWRQKTAYLPLKEFMLGLMDHNYSISFAGKNELEKIANGKFKNRISVSRLGKINSNSPTFKKENNGFLICSCSLLLPVKQVNLIIEVLGILKTKKIKWVHFGDGPLRNELEKYASEKIPHIDYSFRGTVDNSVIIEFYRDNYVDLFINLSESEGIPVSIMEALSAAIPVVAPNVGGIPEIVGSHNGFLIEDSNNTQLIAGMIDHYLGVESERQEAFRKNAYHSWSENYNAETNYHDFYLKITRLPA